jgi:hypothetical protein
MDGILLFSMSFDHAFKLLSLVGAISTFVWTAYTWRENSRKELHARRIEATKPFLERQLALYTAATQSASIIATSEDQAELQAAIKFF